MREFEIDEKTLRRIKLPLLIRDENWILEQENFNNEAIIESSDACKEQLLLEEALEKQSISYKKEKTLLMKRILEWSDAVNSNGNSDAGDKLDEARSRVLEINNLLDDKQFEQEMCQKEIKRLNEQLFHETISAVYSNIISGKARLIEVNDEIQGLRTTLGEKYEEKFGLEKRVESIYKYLHKTMGKSETNWLDEMFLADADDGSDI